MYEAENMDSLYGNNKNILIGSLGQLQVKLGAGLWSDFRGSQM